MTRAGASDYRLDIQGLRAIAILMVVAFHAGLPLPGGFVGVDVFFVVSGFVITGMLVREQDRTGGIALGRFYLRRFKRLTPALALMVAITIVLTAFLLPPLGAQENVAKTGLGAMALIANLVIAVTTGGYFDVGAELNPLLHTWTLSLEEQFYLILPATLVAGWVIANRRGWARLPILLVTLLAAASFAVAFSEASGSSMARLPSWLSGFYGPLGRVWEFACGALLALAAGSLPKPGRATETTLGALGAATLIASLLAIDEFTPFPGPWSLLPVAGTAALIYAGSGGSGPVGRVLALRPMVALGDLSYSWYLWHWPLIVFAALLWPVEPLAVVAAAAVSLAVAALSYRFVEQPIRTMTVSGLGRIGRMVAVTVVPPMALASLLLFAAANSFWAPSVRDFQIAVTERHIGVRAGCNSQVPISEHEDACTWEAEGEGAPIYLVGDSNADQFSEALIGASERLGRPLVIATTSSCPFADTYISDTANPSWWSAEACRDYYRLTLAWLQNQPAGEVIISQSLEYWVSDRFGAGLSLDAQSYETEEKADLYESGLATAIHELSTTGHHVTIVQSIPKFTREYAWDPQRCSLATVVTRRCLASMPLEWDLQRQGPALKAGEAVARTTGSGLFDPRAKLCEPDGVHAGR